MTNQQGVIKAKEKIAKLKEALLKTNDPGDRKGIINKIQELHNRFTTEAK